jgi:heme-degrading monooxygenase HmoA
VLDVIARLWSARATPQLATAYLEYFSAAVLPELKAVRGFLSAQVLTHSIDTSSTKILVMTNWDSFEAIEGFAGTDLEAAVVHPAAAALLSEYDARVRHFNVALSESK